MEKYQLERREKIAAGIVLAAIATKTAIWARKGNKLGHAREYPGKSFIIDVLEDGREQTIRIAGMIKSLNPLRIEIDDREHTDVELDTVEELFPVSETGKDPLQNG